MINAMMIDKDDDVVVAIEPIKAGEDVCYMCQNDTLSFKAIDDITIYHKIAKREITKGNPVIKYGEHIGLASQDVKIGQHVHTHNIDDHREDLK